MAKRLGNYPELGPKASVSHRTNAIWYSVMVDISKGWQAGTPDANRQLPDGNVRLKPSFARLSRMYWNRSYPDKVSGPS